MKLITICLCAAAIVAAFGLPACADDQEELFNKIQKTVDAPLPPADTPGKHYVKDIIPQVEKVIQLCVEYRARYPDGEHLPEVIRYQARGHYNLYRVRKTKSDRVKTFELARLLMNDYPKLDVTADAYVILIEYSLGRYQHDEALKVADNLLKAFPKSSRTGGAIANLAKYCVDNNLDAKALEYAEKALAGFPDTAYARDSLYYTYKVYERRKERKKSVETLEKLVVEYPWTAAAKFAENKLLFLKWKGRELELEFTATDGKKIDVKDYRGKVVLIDFWASWNTPSVIEMPNVLATEKDLRAKGFRVIGISLDQNRENFDKYVKDNSIPWPQYFDGKGWRNLFARKYGINAMPKAFLIGKKGIIREIGLKGEAMEKAARKLLAEQEEAKEEEPGAGEK